MDQQEIRSLLEQVAQGKRSVDEAVLALKMEPFRELGFAKVDNHRGLRQGAAEVIYGAGKTPQQIRDIAASMRETGGKSHSHYPACPRKRQIWWAKPCPCTIMKWAGSELWGQMPEPTGKGNDCGGHWGNQ